MNKIKCRAWDTHLKVMVNDIHTLDTFNEYNSRDRYIIMLCTGRHDIHDGDILRSLHFEESNGNKHYLYHVVEWCDNLCLFKCISKVSYILGDRRLTTNGSVYYHVYLNNSQEITRIGNIHENPKLLK